MNRLSMDLSDLKLSLDEAAAAAALDGCFDEETWLIAPPPSSAHKRAPSGDGGADENAAETPRAGGADEDDDEDLTKWLEGAVRKVDFRTRSALSRRLEKKRRRREKRERLKYHNDNPLAKIDETSGTRVANGDLYGSDDTLGDDDPDDVDPDDDAYFDAADAAEHIDETRSAGALYRTPKTHRSSGRAASLRGGNASRIQPGVEAVPAGGSSRRFAANPQLEEHLDLSELERRAKEQEQELRMELMKRRERLQVGGSNSRPNSASSSASSSAVNVTGGGSMATSRSVDFRAARIQPHLTTVRAGSISSSTDGGGSTGDLNRLADCHTPTPLNSRLPMPRRPVVGGRTGIPLPAPKSTKTGSGQSRTAATLEPRLMTTAPSLLDTDKDCF